MSRAVTVICLAGALLAAPAGAAASGPPAGAGPEARAASICDATLWRSGKVKKTTIIALGGTSYAVATIGTKQIKNNSVRSVDIRNGAIVSKDVKRGGLGGRAIQESALGTVPRANRLGGKTLAQLTLRCPPGMQPIMDSCIEPTPRPALAYGFARVACESARFRLPSYQELISYTDAASGQLAAGGELTADVYPGEPNDSPIALVLINSSGDVTTTPDTFAGGRAFRCAANAING